MATQETKEMVVQRDAAGEERQRDAAGEERQRDAAGEERLKDAACDRDR